MMFNAQYLNYIIGYLFSLYRYFKLYLSILWLLSRILDMAERPDFDVYSNDWPSLDRRRINRPRYPVSQDFYQPYRSHPPLRPNFIFPPQPYINPGPYKPPFFDPYLHHQLAYSNQFPHPNFVHQSAGHIQPSIGPPVMQMGGAQQPHQLHPNSVGRNVDYQAKQWRTVQSTHMRSSGGHTKEFHMNGELWTKVVDSDSVMLVCVRNDILYLHVIIFIGH